MHNLNTVFNGRLILRRVFYNKTLASGEGVAGSFWLNPSRNSEPLNQRYHKQTHSCRQPAKSWVKIEQSTDSHVCASVCVCVCGLSPAGGSLFCSETIIDNLSSSSPQLTDAPASPRLLLARSMYRIVFDPLSSHNSRQKSVIIIFV